MLTSLVLVCNVSTFCACSILYRCGVLFIFVKATPNAHCWINDHLHTFFLYYAVVGDVAETKYFTMKKYFSLLFIVVATCCLFTSCAKEGNDGSLNESDLYGVWYQASPEGYTSISPVIFVISENGMYSKGELNLNASHTGTWKFDEDSRTFTMTNNSGSHIYTIVELDEHNFVLMHNVSGNVQVWER